MLPRSLTVSLSADGERWTQVGNLAHEIPAEREDRFRFTFALALPSGSRARFVRVVAHNPGPLPEWHPGAGRPSWIFADEIVVR